MTHKYGIPGEFEQLVLLAILQLDSEAYGPNISAELEDKAGRRLPLTKATRYEHWSHGITYIP